MEKIKDQERILKAASKKQLVPYTGTPIRLSTDFTAETLWAWYLQSDERKNLQPRILHLARWSFRIEGELKSVTNKQKLKEFSTTKLAVQAMFKGFLKVEKKRPELEIWKWQKEKSHW